jgi:hypothetical protein
LPFQDNIEAACEMITISGKALAASEDKKTRDALEGYMARLQRLADARELSSRIRFVVRDVIDMRKNKWCAVGGGRRGRAAGAGGGGGQRLGAALGQQAAGAGGPPLGQRTSQSVLLTLAPPCLSPQGAAPRDVHCQEAGGGARRGGGRAGHGHGGAHRGPARAARAGAAGQPGWRAAGAMGQRRRSGRCSVCGAVENATRPPAHGRPLTPGPHLLPPPQTQTRLAPEDFSLLPPLRGGEDAGWEFVGRARSGGGKAFTGSSALVGEYRPPEPLVKPKPAAPPPAAAPEAAAPAGRAAGGAGKPLGPEDVEAKTKGLFREFASIGDYNEAATCVRELRDAPKADGVSDLSGVASAGLEEVFDATSEKPAAALAGLLVRLAAEGAITAAELRKGVEVYTEQLEDLRCALMGGWGGD